MDKEIQNIVSKYLDNSISQEELAILDNWCRQDSENEKLFHQLRAILYLVGSTDKKLDAYQKRVWERLKNRTIDEFMPSYSQKTIRKYNFRILLRAASVAIIFGLGILLGTFIVSPGDFHKSSLAVESKQEMADTLIFTSKASSKSELLLPDGSKVWLNSNSEIKFLPDFKTNRHIYLTGEAYFDVSKKEDNKYFYVHTSDIKIEVLGTEFNVKSYPEEGVIETTLEEGEIVLYKKSENTDTQITTLQPNQHATFIKNKGDVFLDQLSDEKQANELKTTLRKEQLIITEHIDTEKYVAWRDGHLIVDGESFESFVNKMERWYDVHIEIKSEKVKKLHFTANFKNETVEQALQALRIAHPFNYTFDIDKNLIVIE